MKNSDIVLTEALAKTDSTVGTKTVSTEKDLLNTYMQFSDVGYFDTGLLPLEGTGLLSLRHAGDRTQFVFQHAAGIQYMLWGKHEGDKSAKALNVAQPYRIVIADHVDGEFRGARHFYSPVPVLHAEQPLYHCNVPNLNCRGYNGTSVGWICLYHNETYKDLSLGQKIFRSVERASGHEAYNDANMSETDGPRFYKNHYQGKVGLEYLWDPSVWQAKTKKDGWEWVLDSDIWIPVKVAGIDSQDAHDPNGVPLTLEMAMLGNYKSYYPHRQKDEANLSLMNRIRRPDIKNPTSKEIFDVFVTGFRKALKKEEQKQVSTQAKITGISGTLITPVDDAAQTGEPAPAAWNKQTAPPPEPDPNPSIGNCLHCKGVVKAQDDHWKDIKNKLVCKACHTQFYVETKCCGLDKLAGDIFYDNQNLEFLCFACHVLTICDNCESEFVDSPESVFDNHCLECEPNPVYCDMCGGKFSHISTHKVTAAKPVDGVLLNEIFNLCNNCMSNSVICKCGLLKDQNTVSNLPDSNDKICGPCVQFQDNGTPVHVSVHQKA